MDVALSGLKRIGTIIPSVLREVGSCLFATECLACASLLSGALFCGSCRQFEMLGTQVCDQCGTTTSAPISQCGECLKSRDVPWTAGRSLWWLNDTAKAWIAAVKFENRFELIDALKPDFLRDFVTPFPAVDCVIPVPLHPNRLASRGFNQAERIGRWVAELLRAPLETHTLFRMTHAPAQSLLGRARRLRNTRGAFAVPSREKVGKSVLLIDDIWTSGSTVRSAASALARAGVENIYVWTLFRTPEKKTPGRFPCPALRN